MTKRPDVNDLHRAGTLPADPFDPAAVVPMAEPDQGEAPGRVHGEVLAKAWRTIAERSGTDPEGRPLWFAEIPPRRRYLLEVPASPENGRARGMLPRGKVGMLAAGGGVGKTMALTQLALAVATGRPWLGGGGWEGFTVPEGEAGRVLLALAEEDEDEARRRLFNAARMANLSHAELVEAARRIVVLPLAGEMVSLVEMEPARHGVTPEVRASPLAVELARRLSEGGPWSLVILDPLSRFAGPDTETDNAAATRFVQVIEGLTKAPGEPTVLFAHHNTKDARRNSVRDDTGARGASALSDGARWHAALTSESRPEGAGADVPRMAVFEVVKVNGAAPLDAPLWLARGENGELRAASKGERQTFRDAVAEAEARERAEKHAAKERMAEKPKEKPEAKPKENGKIDLSWVK